MSITLSREEVPHAGITSRCAWPRIEVYVPREQGPAPVRRDDAPYPFTRTGPCPWCERAAGFGKACVFSGSISDKGEEK